MNNDDFTPFDSIDFTSEVKAPRIEFRPKMKKSSSKVVLQSQFDDFASHFAANKLFGYYESSTVS